MSGSLLKRCLGGIRGRCREIGVAVLGRRTSASAISEMLHHFRGIQLLNHLGFGSSSVLSSLLNGILGYRASSPGPFSLGGSCHRLGLVAVTVIGGVLMKQILRLR
jgi:hypothetical protein